MQDAYTGNVGELIGTLEVGQTFESIRPRLSAVAFQVATYSGRANTEDVIFELRSRPEDGKPLRTVRVNARRFGDHQRFTFSFPAVPDSLGKTYYASLRSPTGKPGNAITVDSSNQNPYEKTGPSSLLLLRRERGRVPDIAEGTKLEADLAFAVIHDIPLWERLRLTAGAIGEAVLENQGRWWLDARLAIVGVLLAFATLGFTRLRPEAPGVSQWGSMFRRGALLSPRLLPFVLGFLLIVGVFLRLLFANRLPYTNDEGTALYDAWTILQGRLPGGDGVLKTPVYLGALAGGLAAFGPTLMAGRLVSILAGVLTAFPLLGLARRASRRATAPLALWAFWLLAGAPVIFSVYAHAQSVQLLLVTSGLAAFAGAFSRTSPPGDRKKYPSMLSSAGSLALCSGVLFALALGARKTSLAAALPAVLLLLGSPHAWRTRARVLGISLVGFALTLGGLIALEFSLYGSLGVRYFLGIDVASIDPATTGSLEERRSAFIKGVVPFFREGLPLIFWALAGIGGGLETFIRRLAPGSLALARGVWILPLALAWEGGSFLRMHERGEHFAFGLWPFWVAMGAALLGMAFLPRRGDAENAEAVVLRDHRTSRVIRAVNPFLVPTAWFIGTALVYASWIKFTANYLAEFLPAVILLAGSGALWFVQTLKPRFGVLFLAGALTAWGAFSAARLGHTFPHTGTFDRASIEEAARYLRANAPPEEPVLTAAVAIPLLSGHRVPFDVAHPTHYAYGFIEPSVRNIYMAPSEAMVRAAKEDVRWFVHEKLTDFSYFLEYPELRQLVEEKFEPVAEFENLSNPITIFRRK